MKNERGSATLVVLTLLVVLTACAIGNGMVLHHLRADLKRIERHQLEKYQPGSR